MDSHSEPEDAQQRAATADLAEAATLALEGTQLGGHADRPSDDDAFTIPEVGKYFVAHAGRIARATTRSSGLQAKSNQLML